MFMTREMIELKALVNVVSARLNGEPTDKADWSVIARQLASAASEAKKIADSIAE